MHTYREQERMDDWEYGLNTDRAREERERDRVGETNGGCIVCLGRWRQHGSTGIVPRSIPGRPSLWVTPRSFRSGSRRRECCETQPAARGTRCMYVVRTPTWRYVIHIIIIHTYAKCNTLNYATMFCNVCTRVLSALCTIVRSGFGWPCEHQTVVLIKHMHIQTRTYIHARVPTVPDSNESRVWQSDTRIGSIKW